MSITRISTLKVVLMVLLLSCSGALKAQGEGALESSDSSSVWTGLYVGGSLAFGRGEVDWVHNENIGTDESFSVNPEGLLGGVHFGYQAQRESLVLGGEASLWFGKFEDSQQSGPGAINPGDPRKRTAILSGIMAASGKVGFVQNSLLFYGKAGLALADIKFEHLRSDGRLFPNDLGRRVGYLAGLGVEYKATERVSFGIDYSYLSFGGRSRSDIQNSNCNGSPCGDTLGGIDTSIISARANFHF